MQNNTFEHLEAVKPSNFTPNYAKATYSKQARCLSTPAAKSAFVKGAFRFARSRCIFRFSKVMARFSMACNEEFGGSLRLFISVISIPLVYGVRRGVSNGEKLSGCTASQPVMSVPFTDLQSRIK